MYNLLTKDLFVVTYLAAPSIDIMPDYQLYVNEEMLK